jgi:hypothetical protein
MSLHESFLIYRSMLYPKIAVAMAGTALLCYVVDSPRGVPSGSTWLGYTLGTVGALLIVWLMWFGMRKRRYGPGEWRLEAWLSAHVYFGLALVVIATLHTGFRFHWTIHTLAYALMMMVIGSGVFGVYAYARYPRLMTDNRRGETLRSMLAKLTDIDRESRAACLELPDEFVAAVRISHQETRIGGSLRRQLSGVDRNCGTTRALAQIEELATTVPVKLDVPVMRLVRELQRKQELLAQLRRDLRYKALMEIWLYCHVPLSFMLLAALTAHIVSVFFYF